VQGVVLVGVDVPSRQLRLKTFGELDINDPFFDSLKASYTGFEDWFARKSKEELYIVEDGAKISGMIYLKSEPGPVLDVNPPLPNLRWMKVGTLKIEGRGTKLGERVLKKIFDTALSEEIDGIYVTVFDVHAELIRLFERYGFYRAGTKTTESGEELVYVRRLDQMSGDRLRDYPFMHVQNKRAWLLAVYPEYHTQLLPDSILNNEPREIVRDVSHTNTIHKVYIGKIPLTRMGPGDPVVIYRTSDKKAPAYYRSVVSSVCVVEEVKRKKDFADIDAYLMYASPHSVFSKEVLREKYLEGDRLYIARMTYNVALNRRITRGRLLEDGVVTEQPRWDLRELTMTQFRQILHMGDVDARIVVD
jgi:L-amino acid N-acyltransferase YncA